MTATQTVTFAIHLILFIPSLYYAIKSSKKAQWIYINMCVGWLAGILYYTMLIESIREHLDLNMHTISPYLRIFQAVAFGSWVLIKMVNDTFSSELGNKIWKTFKISQMGK